MTELFLFQLQFWKKNWINISINVHQNVQSLRNILRILYKHKFMSIIKKKNWLHNYNSLTLWPNMISITNSEEK